MNLAAVWKSPVVFVAENNHYGEFTSQERHQCIESITERAAGYGIPGAIVDGNDLVAVYEAAAEAVDRARKGRGPTLLECKTYRIKGHFVGDPEVYRGKEEVEAWQKADKDPILRFEKKLVDTKALTKDKVKKIRESVQKEIEEAVKFAEESPEPDVSDLMDGVYA
jgi:pyruvate dehydrogenase E1 component alpha subunit